MPHSKGTGGKGPPWARLPETEVLFLQLVFKTSLCDDLGRLTQGQNNTLVGKGLTKIPEVSPSPGLFPEPYLYLSRSTPYPSMDLQDQGRPSSHTKHTNPNPDMKHSHFVLIAETNPTVAMQTCMLSRFSRVWPCANPWTVARQGPLSKGFSRQEYWSGLPCPPPGDLPYPGIEPTASPVSSLSQVDFFYHWTTWEQADVNGSYRSPGW